MADEFFNFDAIIEIEKKKSYNKALEDVESKAQEFIDKHIEEYGVEIVEGNSEAFDDLRAWLAENRK